MGGADLSVEGIVGDFEKDQYHPVTVKKKKIHFFRICGFDKVNKKGGTVVIGTVASRRFPGPRKKVPGALLCSVLPVSVGFSQVLQHPPSACRHAFGE